MINDKETSEEEISEDKNAPSTESATPPTLLPEAQIDAAQIHRPESADLLRTTADPTLTEDLALALLKRADLPPEVLEQLAKNAKVLKSRKVKIALASHPHTPRHVSVPLARQFYIFDLMKLALSPRVPADVRVAVDDVLISRLKTVTVGERLTLARRASGRVAAALLLDIESMDGKIMSRKTIAGKMNNADAVARQTRVMQTALENPRLTEALVINSVLRPAASAALVHAVARHEKWSPRREVRAALLRTAHLSPARALEFSREIPASVLHDVLDSSRLPAEIKNQLLRQSGSQKIRKFDDSQ
ncbi:MAG: hypothetical protein ABSF66_11040 [Terriglobales bacterium]